VIQYLAELKDGMRELLMRSKPRSSKIEIKFPVEFPLKSVECIKAMEAWIGLSENRNNLVTNLIQNSKRY